MKLVEQYRRLQSMPQTKDIDIADREFLSNNANSSVESIVRQDRKATAISLIPLLLRKNILDKRPDAQGELNQAEKTGILYFNALVLKADDFLDGGFIEGKRRQNPQTIRSQILDASLPYSGIPTMTDLLTKTLAQFSPEKQQLIERFLDKMVQIEASTGPVYPGNYNLTDALMYRQKTNNPWVETTFKLADITDAEQLEWFQQIGVLFQFEDDLEDWPEDWVKNNPNLFIGLVNETDHRELDKMRDIVYEFMHPKASAVKEKPNAWSKKTLPNSFGLYRDIYFDELRHLPDPLMRLFLRLKSL